MPTPPLSVVARPARGSGFTRVGDQYALPERIEAAIEPANPRVPLVHLVITVEGGRASCEELRLQRREGGSPVTGAQLREVPVADYVRRATDQVGYWLLPGQGPATVTFDGDQYPLRSEKFDDEHIAVPLGGLTHTPEWKVNEDARRRRARVTDEELREVAEVYKAAVARGASPTRAVEMKLMRSHSTAARWVMKARERGFLEPTRPGVARG